MKGIVLATESANSGLPTDPLGTKALSFTEQLFTTILSFVKGPTTRATRYVDINVVVSKLTS